MSTDAPHRRPALERLEERLALSATASVGFGEFVEVPGVVKSPGAKADVTIPVGPERFQHRTTTIFGLSARPAPGGRLDPSIGSARNALGAAIPLHPGAPNVTNRNNGARAYIKDGVPGPFSATVTGRHATTGPFVLGADLPGDINGDGRVDFADEALFVKSFPSKIGQRSYNPLADFNHNGQVGLDDAKLLLRNFSPLPPNVPLSIHLALGPRDRAKGPMPQNSGGVTHHQEITIVGKTTPGALVFTDSGQGDYSFSGPAVATTPTGDFSITEKNTAGINTYTFMAIDPCGRQTIRAFPVYWLDFGKTRTT